SLSGCSGGLALGCCGNRGLAEAPGGRDGAEPPGRGRRGAAAGGGPCESGWHRAGCRAPCCGQRPAQPFPAAGAAAATQGGSVAARPLLASFGLLGVQELEAIKAKVREMEKEDEWLQELQAEAKTFILRSDPGVALGVQTAEEKIEVDQRSIYVGNVDYGGSAEELEAHFSACGQINRVTILCDKFSGHPKGYAYIEFADGASVKAAVRLDESTFRGRAIKVLPKRTNMPGISSTDRGRSQGRFHGRGALARRAGFCGRGQRSRTRGRAHRCFGRARFSPGRVGPAGFGPF
uniref:PABPN1 like, cytoplasmic n=1 Tax=Varanus komodoensis TaxID=61221 RepID=A0A8D2IZL6_VARKO